MYQAKHMAGEAKHLAAKKRKRQLFRRAVSILLLSAAVGYGTFVFCAFAPIRYWRDIYIETAMTTANHKWLATFFIPHSIIREVMGRQTGTVEGIGGLAEENALPHPTLAPAAVSDTAAVTPAPSPAPVPAATPADILGQAGLTAGQKNEQGDLVLVNDIAQGIVIYEIATPGYVAHLALIDDPARVFVGTTDKKEERGTLICDYLSRDNAVLGINANGFADEEGHGTGGTIAGLTASCGENWGAYKDSYVSFGFTENDRLLVGMIPDWEEYRIRDGAQFKPALIMDGEIVTAGSNGWGLQPRSCIGQREDGAVLMLVVDGRQPGYSIGATVGDCAGILQRYGAVNAACCDGGSSAVMAYNGSLIGVPSTSMKTTGRWLPNAFLVAKKEAA